MLSFVTHVMKSTLQGSFRIQIRTPPADIRTLRRCESPRSGRSRHLVLSSMEDDGYFGGGELL